MQDDGRNCQSGNNDIRISWVHYLAGKISSVPTASVAVAERSPLDLAAMTFDAVAMGISTRFLTAHTSTLSLCVKFDSAMPGTWFSLDTVCSTYRMSGLSQLMLKEGMSAHFVLPVPQLEA